MKGLLTLVLVVAGTATDFAAPYDDHRAAAIAACEAIDPSAYQSGLYFNPAGYRSFYVRSECLQRVAVRFRDASLCSRVRRRWSLLSSSWGYSPSNCRALVAKGLAKDRAMLEQIRAEYQAAHMLLRDFRIELDNNGRDFDLIPVAEGGGPHGYFLRFDVMPEPSGEPVTLHSDGYWIGDTGLRIYVRRDDIVRRVPGFSSGRPYTVSATMTLSIPVINGDAEFSDAFIADVFPERDRSQTVTGRVAFPPPIEPR